MFEFRHLCNAHVQLHAPVIVQSTVQGYAFIDNRLQNVVNHFIQVKSLLSQQPEQFVLDQAAAPNVLIALARARVSQYTEKGGE